MMLMAILMPVLVVVMLMAHMTMVSVLLVTRSDDDSDYDRLSVMTMSAMLIECDEDNGGDDVWTFLAANIAPRRSSRHVLLF